MTLTPAPTAPAPDYPKLETKRLRLGPFDPADAPVIIRGCSDFEIAINLGRPPYPYPPEAAREWIEKTYENFANNIGHNFAARLRTAGEMVGSVGLIFDTPNERAELGYWFAKDHWGRGYATEAARAVLDYGFRTLRLHRIFASHYHWNPASGRVLAKIGMTPEGVQRQHQIRLGQRADLHLLGALRDEYLAAHPNPI